MQVYIYINPDMAVYLSGILSEQSLEMDTDAITISYSTRDTSGYRLMVSITLDQFIWLQDQGWIKEYEILIN